MDSSKTRCSLNIAVRCVYLLLMILLIISLSMPEVSLAYFDFSWRSTSTLSCSLLEILMSHPLSCFNIRAFMIFLLGCGRPLMNFENSFLRNREVLSSVQVTVLVLHNPQIFFEDSCIAILRLGVSQPDEDWNTHRPLWLASISRTFSFCFDISTAYSSPAGIFKNSSLLELFWALPKVHCSLGS